MAQKKGRVSSISGDGWATVVTEKGDACNNCGSSQFCHSLVDCSRMETRVINQAGAGVGDLVSINLSSMGVLKSALILYILPTISLLFGAVAGAELRILLGISETAAAILFGFAGLILGFAIAKFISKRQEGGNKLTPIIIRIIRPTTGFDLSRIPAGYEYK